MLALRYALPVIALTGCAVGSGGFIENELLSDAIYGENDDRNYTQGSGWIWQEDIYRGEDQKEVDDYPVNHRVLNYLSTGFLAFKEGDEATNCSEPFRTSAFGITAFTPDDLDAFTIQRDDRPYASLVSLSATHQRLCYREYIIPTIAWSHTLNLGLLGTTLGEGFQRWAHETLEVSGNLPNGWDNQISDGGEPTMLYTLERSRLLLNIGKDAYNPPGTRSHDGVLMFSGTAVPMKSNRRQIYLQVFDIAGFDLGYYTTLYAGIGGRLSFSSVPFSTAFNDTGGSENPLNTMFVGNDKVRDNFFFARIQSNAIVYNAMMQGQFRKSDYSLDSTDLNRLVITASVGVSSTVTRFCRWFTGWTKYVGVNVPCGESIERLKKTRMVYAVHYRSSEYDSDVENRDHVWGGLYFSNFRRSLAPLIRKMPPPLASRVLDQ